MILSERKKADIRLRRKGRIRKRVRGTPERPRLSVYKSNRHVFVQVVDDLNGLTLAAASTLSKEIREELKGKKKAEACRLVGGLLARKCREKGIRTIVFDRNGFLYHGRIKAVAEGARGNGLAF